MEASLENVNDIKDQHMVLLSFRRLKLEIFSINKGRLVIIEILHVSISKAKEVASSKECVVVLWQALLPGDFSLIVLNCLKQTYKIIGNPFNNNGNFG